MGLFSGITKIWSGRKGEKSARNAERQNAVTFTDATRRAENALMEFMPSVKERSGVAGNVLLKTLQSLQGGDDYSPSPGVLNTINNLSTKERERSAASGLSQSGGLQGELEKIRSNILLNDAERQSQRKFGNALRLLSGIGPYATEAQNLSSQKENLNLGLSNAIAGGRVNYVQQAAPGFRQQGEGLGQALESGAKALGFGF